MDEQLLEGRRVESLPRGDYGPVIAYVRRVGLHTIRLKVIAAASEQPLEARQEDSEHGHALVRTFETTEHTFYLEVGAAGRLAQALNTEVG